MMQQPPRYTPVPEAKTFRPPQAGDVIVSPSGKRFFLGSPIGRGYYGAVYECTDEWGNYQVAKVIVPQQRTYSQVQADWYREFTNLTQFRHPNITYVYDAFEYGDTFYLVLERCPHSLQEFLRWEGIDRERWLPFVASDVLQALDYLHGAGYVHKDLHPGNVYLSPRHDDNAPGTRGWTFKLGDLGISKPEFEVAYDTVFAQWMLPPEFLDPQLGVLDRRVDIYHAGLLLLRLLSANDLQFSREEIIAGRPRMYAESLPSPYAQPIARALRRRVWHRTATALEFWRELCAADRPHMP